MTTQTELFPRTTLELLEELAEVHRADHDKAAKALDALGDDEKIARAYEKAEERLAKARHLVAAIDQAAERERKRLTATTDPASGWADGAGVLVSVPPAVNRRTGESILQGAADIVNSGALDHDGVTVTASVTPATRNLLLDPITGEVAPAVVLAFYPGDDDHCLPHETPVGDRTRYGELVADYLATLPAVSSHRNDPVAYYRVIGVEDEIDRDLRSPVAPEDYGVELAVVRLVEVPEAKLLEDAVR